MNNTLEFKVLSEKNSEELATLLTSTDSNYNKYFVPFRFENNVISDILNKVTDDLYVGIFINNSIQGFFMLRGFDEGYETPSYGVWVSPAYSSNGIARLTLEYVFTVCRQNKIRKIMLKVHPNHVNAKSLYERMGFEFNYCDQNGYLVYYKTIKL